MMGWMMDEYSKLVGQYTPGVFTGKPLGGGGSEGRTEATGYGVIYTVREAMKHLKMDPKNSVAAIEGFGNVAQYAAIGFIEMLGGKVACVSCWDRADKKSYTYSHKDGVDPRFLLTIVDEYGTIDKKKAQDKGYVIEDGDAWISKDADVLIPAAIEGHVNADTVKKMSKRVKLVAEGANGPVTPEADEYFKANKIFDVPDFLCNAGGVTMLLLRVGPERHELLLDQAGSPREAGHQDDPGLPRRAGYEHAGKGLHARRGLHGRHRPRGQGHEAARLGLGTQQLSDRPGHCSTKRPKTEAPIQPNGSFLRHSRFAAGGVYLSGEGMPLPHPFLRP